MNLHQVIADVNEIKYIKSLPPDQEYEPNQQNLIMMSLTLEERMKSAQEKKLYKIRRLRDKVTFRLRSAEEQFIQLKKELDYFYRVLEEQPLDDLVKHYHPDDEIFKVTDEGGPLPLR